MALLFSGCAKCGWQVAFADRVFLGVEREGRHTSGAKEGAEKVPLCERPQKVEAIGGPTNDLSGFFDCLMYPQMPLKQPSFETGDFFITL